MNSNKAISTHQKTRALLEQYQLRAKKHFGQNFLIDSNTVRKIAQIAEAENQSVLEIGPGLGALTEELLKQAKQLTVIEIDGHMVEILKENFGDQLTILHQDVLKMTREDLNPSITHLVGNLPYYITTPILFHVLENFDQFKVMTFMVQKEVAERFSAKVNTKAYNALTIILHSLCEVSIEMIVSKHVFHPAPQVDSAIVKLKRNEQAYQALEGFFSFVKKGFTQRRKTLMNNIKEEAMASALTECGLSLSIRAEAIDLEAWKRLYASYLHQKTLKAVEIDS